MKKTLVALAALAATGASFAQVTITGNLTAGFQNSVTNSYTGLAYNGSRVVTQNTNSGFGVDTAEVFFTAKEDIGGGQFVEAKLGIDNGARGATAPMEFGPHDLTLTYTNMSLGRFQLGNTRGGAVFSGLPTAGAPVVDMDAKLFEARSYSEYLQYAAPIGPFTIVYQYGESGPGKSLAAGSAGTGAGVGAGTSGASTNVRQRSNMLLAAYKDGPLQSFVVYKTYDNRNADDGLTGTIALTKDDQWSVQGNYDFGAAKVGFGYAFTRASIGATVSDMLVGVNVPLGSLEVGATVGREVVANLRDLPAAKFSPTLGGFAKPIMQEAEGTATGWSVGAKYSFDKRTSFKVNYAAWTRSGYAQFESAAATNVYGIFGNASVETQYNLLLSHSF